MVFLYLGGAVCHWSMSVQAPGIFIMNKEQRVEVPVDFCEKNAALVPFVEFYSTVAVSNMKQRNKKVINLTRCNCYHITLGWLCRNYKYYGIAENRAYCCCTTKFKNRVPCQYCESCDCKTQLRETYDDCC